MPFAHLMFTTPPSPALREAAADTLRNGIAGALSALIATRLRKRSDLVALRVEPVPAAQWTIGGTPLQDAAQAGAHLQVQVSAGTNTAAEMEAFVAEAFALLESRLGPLHPASYVVVQELPATAWGWGGRTQHGRRLEQGATAPAGR
ncbi:tautomerase family protein [Caldimonas tepidiphila]|uniref:tautomerase family protein n=1 Tax=Caldimonas tepidiphila TaxID=2315841 RepID=UPI00196BB275|nr:4-oxalocrotonate tautomerase [Caldimonas tepidiphila]